MLQTSSSINDEIMRLGGQHLKLLVVEDEVLFARAVVRKLKKAGFECEHAENIADAKAIVKQFAPDITLLDMRLPDGNGLDLLPELVSQNIACIVMTAHGDVSDAVSAMKQGALDYLKKPIDLDELLISVQKAEKSTAQSNQLDYSKQRDAHSTDGVEFLGESNSIRQIKSQVQRISQLVAVDVVPPTVMILGETGTGKDVVARYLHACGPNNDRPFVHVDCASLPADLIESELFGHEKGAFTGAVSSRPGLIEAAEDGSLFLDEIGELPLPLQAKLLNVLERRVVRRLGSSKERPVAARFIAATNRDLQVMSNEGNFRQDLYYRLNVMSVTLPPLRDRENDPMLLAMHFAEQTARRYGLPENPTFAQDAIVSIQQYAWPGNVRELRHQVSRSVLLCQNNQIVAFDLALPNMASAVSAAPAAEMPMPMMANSVESTYANIPTEQHPSTSTSNMTLDEAERTMLMQALESAKYNVSEAARQLGITRMTMRYRMQKHNIKV